MPAPAALEVQGRPMTYEEASEEEFNVLSRLGYGAAVEALADDLWRRRQSIEALTRQQLGLGKHDTCNVLERREWIRGGFNICVLLSIVPSGGQARKVVVRCAMPHKLVEATYPGTVDGKLGCEVGAYVFMQRELSSCWHSPSLWLWLFRRASVHTCVPHAIPGASLAHVPTLHPPAVQPGASALPVRHAAQLTTMCPSPTCFWSTSMLNRVRCYPTRGTSIETTLLGGRSSSVACLGECCLWRVCPSRRSEHFSSTTMAL